MGLFDFLSSKPKNKKVDIDGKEVVDFTDLTVPVPVVHSNTIDGEHDVFSKALIDEPITIETEKEDVTDIPYVQEEEVQDLSSINAAPIEPAEPTPEVEVTPQVEETKEPNSEDMEIFKACLLAEVKRKKGTGVLVTEEDVKNYCHDRMVEYKEGKFDYPEDVKKSMKKMLDAKNMIQSMMPKKEAEEEVSIKKVA